MSWHLSPIVFKLKDRSKAYRPVIKLQSKHTQNAVSNKSDTYGISKSSNTNISFLQQILKFIMKSFLLSRLITRRKFTKDAIVGCVTLALLPIVLKRFRKHKSNAFAGSVENPKKPMKKPSVIRVYSPQATNWDYKTFPYVNSIDQDVINEMVTCGIKELTGQSDLFKGWQQIMTGYKPGDKVAIKPNFNNIDSAYKEIVTSYQVINAVLTQLVKVLQIPPRDIFLYDCSGAIYGWMKDKILYPVNYVYGDLITVLDRLKNRVFGNPLAKADPNVRVEMRGEVVDKTGNPVTCYIPRLLTDAQHLINIPVFKNHVFVLTSNALKNHFGTVRFSDGSLSPKHLHGQILEKSIVDINLNTHIKDKTRLIIVDGLFGKYDWGDGKQGPKKWATFPGDSTPNSLFFSIDPVAVESVISDFIKTEREFRSLGIFPHEYLHDAMENNLGVHEHRNAQGLYSRIHYVETVLH